MNHASSSKTRDGQNGAYRIELPRVGEAVGRSLRNAYPGHSALPKEMVEILSRLNGRTRF